MFYAFCSVLVVCELGERFTIAYDGIDCEIEKFDWYSFPIEVQRLLPVLMLNAQQPVTIECFASTSTNREAFKKVIETVDIEILKRKREAKILIQF